MNDVTALSVHSQPFVKLSKKDCSKEGAANSSMKAIIYVSAYASLMYVMFVTRADITHVVGIASRFMVNPGKAHWKDPSS
mgnify:FL=1